MVPPYQSQSRQNIIWKSQLEQLSKAVKSPWRREVGPAQEHWLPHCMELVKAWDAVDLSRATILTQTVRDDTSISYNSSVLNLIPVSDISENHSKSTFSPMLAAQSLMIPWKKCSDSLWEQSTGPGRGSRKIPETWVLELPVSSGEPHKQESGLVSQRASWSGEMEVRDNRDLGAIWFSAHIALPTTVCSHY